MVASFENLIDAFRDRRARYAALVDRLSDGSAIEDADVELEYQRLHSEWDDGEPEGHDVNSPYTSLRIQFREALQPIPPLLMEVEQELVIRSVRSARDSDLLRAYRELPFIQKSREYIRSAPFQTLRGLDAAISVLRSSEHTEEIVTHEQKGHPTHQAQDDSLPDSWPADEAMRRTLAERLQNAMDSNGDNRKTAAPKIRLSPRTLDRLLTAQATFKPKTWRAARRYIEQSESPR